MEKISDNYYQITREEFIKFIEKLPGHASYEIKHLYPFTNFINREEIYFNIDTIDEIWSKIKNIRTENGLTVGKLIKKIFPNYEPPKYPKKGTICWVKDEEHKNWQLRIATGQGRFYINQDCKRKDETQFWDEFILYDGTLPKNILSKL